MRVNVSKENIEKFDNSNIGKIKNKYLKRTKITGILCVSIGLIWLILSIYYHSKWYDMVTSILLIVFGIYFIINSHIIKLKEVNKYIYENKKTQ